MTVPEYEYTVEQCDVPAVRRKSMAEYRSFRRKCLEYMRGESNTSVSNQLHFLTWHTAVFRTLNEARRLEPDRPVNGAMWELITDGYANLMTLGIRRLVDKDPRTDSLWNVIAQVEKRPELLTREKFICYDGLPYDYSVGFQKYVASLDLTSGGRANWLSTKGPEAWATSEMMHKAFDVLAGHPQKRKRTDPIQPSILANVNAILSSKSIEAVCTLADRTIAHAERLSENSHAVPLVTYNDIDNALGQLIRVTNYLSGSFFYDTAIGSAVPTPQFNVLEALDSGWTSTDNIPALHDFWRETCDSMDRWLELPSEGFTDVSPGKT
jgi:hypothetical protein